MNIVFVFSDFLRSNAIADYVFRLAGELEKRGDSVSFVGFATRGCEQVTLSTPECHYQKLSGSLLSIPASWNWIERVRESRRFFARMRADWISLQVVPFSFQNKGIVFSLAPTFRRLFRGFPLHLFFHELWLGDREGAPMKERIWGLLQKVSLQRVLRMLQPSRVQTSNPFYCFLLERIGWKAGLNPIPSCFPPLKRAIMGAKMAERIRHLCPSLANHPRSSHRLFGLFGNVSHLMPWSALVDALVQQGRRHSFTPVLVQAGRLSPQTEKIFVDCQKQFETQMSIIRLGELIPEEVSEYLFAMDFGICSTPRELMWKSSATMTLVEHGLPIISHWDISFGAPRQYRMPNIPCVMSLEEFLQLRKFPFPTQRFLNQQQCPAADVFRSSLTESDS